MWWGNGGLELVQYSSNYWASLRPKPKEPMPNTNWMHKNQKLGNSEKYLEPNMTDQKEKKKVCELIPIYIPQYHRLAPNTTLRETSSCSLWEHMWKRRGLGTVGTREIKDTRRKHLTESTKQGSQGLKEIEAAITGPGLSQVLSICCGSLPWCVCGRKGDSVSCLLLHLSPSSEFSNPVLTWEFISVLMHLVMNCCWYTNKSGKTENGKEKGLGGMQEWKVVIRMIVWGKNNFFLF